MHCWSGLTPKLSNIRLSVMFHKRNGTMYVLLDEVQLVP